MWGAIVAGIAFVLAAVFSLAKASSNADKMAEKHREELFSRKDGEISASVEKSAEKGEEPIGAAEKTYTKTEILKT